MWPKTFREMFCERWGCSADAFERRVFWQCLHRRSLPLAALVYAFHRKYFELDLQTIRQLGVSRSPQEFRAELESFRYEYRSRGGFLRQIRVRVSGKRLITLLREVAPTTDQRPRREALVTAK